MSALYVSSDHRVVIEFGIVPGAQRASPVMNRFFPKTRYLSDWFFTVMIGDTRSAIIARLVNPIDTFCRKTGVCARVTRSDASCFIEC
jgi:hypothetical protein